MSQSVIPFHSALPDFMKDASLFGHADDVAGGIVGAQPPYISIKASKFRLIDAGGEEEIVNQLYLDVVVLSANPHLSKIYYQGKYDPSSGDANPPTCFSDNGVGPSDRSTTPQSMTCVICPHNAWGSRKSELTGKSVKACSDSKKIAVILAKSTPTLKGGVSGSVPAGAQVYMVRVPATSMGKLRDIALKAKAAGVPLLGCVLRLSFNAEASYPQIDFLGQGWIDETLFSRARGLVDSADVRQAIGADDKPISGGAVTSFENPPAHLRGPEPTAATATSTPNPPHLNGGAAEAVPVETPRRRGRPPKAAAETAVVEAAVSQAEASFDDKAGQSAVVMAPTASDASLDDMMASIFK